MALSKTQHINILKLAEQQFRFACTAHFALASGTLSLDMPIEWTFGTHRTGYKEFGLRVDQAVYAAATLEYISTFAMASSIRQAFADCVESPRNHSNSEIVSAYQISRMIRNSFAHQMLSPVWSIDGDCRDRQFVVRDIISLDTHGLNGQIFDWRHYGGHLAIWRLSQWVRLKVLDDVPPVDRIEPGYPKREAYQQGRVIFVRLPEAADDQQ